MAKITFDGLDKYRDQMEKILQVHFSKLDDRLLQQAMEAFYWLRSIDGIEKKPSTSELVDWVRALTVSGIPVSRIRREIPFRQKQYDEKANIVAIDYDPGASTVNQLNRIKLMMSTAFKNLEEEKASYYNGNRIEKAAGHLIGAAKKKIRTRR